MIQFTEESLKESILNKIAKLSVLVDCQIPDQRFNELAKCYLDVSIYLLKKYPLNENQFEFVTGNFFGGTDVDRNSIKTVSDIANNLVIEPIYKASFILGMRNFWYILHEQLSISITDLQYVKDMLEPLLKYFVGEDDTVN